MVIVNIDFASPFEIVQNILIWCFVTLHIAKEYLASAGGTGNFVPSGCVTVCSLFVGIVQARCVRGNVKYLRRCMVRVKY